MKIILDFSFLIANFMIDFSFLGLSIFIYWDPKSPRFSVISRTKGFFLKVLDMNPENAVIPCNIAGAQKKRQGVNHYAQSTFCQGKGNTTTPNPHFVKARVNHHAQSTFYQGKGNTTTPNPHSVFYLQACTYCSRTITTADGLAHVALFPEPRSKVSRWPSSSYLVSLTMTSHRGGN